MKHRFLSAALAGLLFAGAAIAQNHDELQPHKVKHVLLISVDGLHALDLSNYIATHNDSAFARLSRSGVTYTNASSALPSDSFPGLAALITGGSPQTTGLWYDVTYNRRLSPPAETTPYGITGGQGLCPAVAGTQVGFDEQIDVDLTQLNGGAPQKNLTDAAINPSFLPRDPDRGCKPVFPHEYLRVNTIFEVVKASGGYTAWSDKHPSYEWVKGPSGEGLDDFYGPEINSVPVNLPQVKILSCNPLPDPAKTTPDDAWTSSTLNIQCYDALKVQAVLNEIHGFTHDGTRHAPVPAVFGMNFQAVSVGQKLKHNGYADAFGTPSAGLLSELDFVDRSLERMIEALKKQGLYDSTLIIVGAKHGQSPIDPSKRVAIPGSTPQTVVGPAYAFDISDDVSLIWLTDPGLASGVAASLSSPASQQALGIQEIFSGAALSNKWNDPGSDPRTPDIILKTNTGVIFTGGSKLAEHGGLNEDDLHVGLLVSLAGLSQKTVKTSVTNQQVAPTILKALGLDPSRLDAVRQEQTSVLPFLFSDGDRDDR